LKVSHRDAGADGAAALPPDAPSDGGWADALDASAWQEPRDAGADGAAALPPDAPSDGGWADALDASAWQEPRDAGADGAAALPPDAPSDGGWADALDASAWQEPRDAGGESAQGQLCGSVVHVAMGWHHTCALASDGSLWCWGDNSSGQLGDGTGETRAAPVQVASPGSGVVQLTASGNSTCALGRDGWLWCWGVNDGGQLSSQTFAYAASPTLVSGLGAAVAQVALAVDYACARRTDGSVWCWGYLNAGSVTSLSFAPVQVAGISRDAASLAAGASHVCALKVDGTVYCWGNNNAGQLGNGSTVSSLVPVQVMGLDQPALRIYAGSDETCAIVKDGSLWCWGSSAVNTTPVLAANLPDTEEVALGMQLSCARKRDGTLACWGLNDHGQLGDGTLYPSGQPVTVASVTGAKQVAVGESTACAIDATSNLRCWGSNDWGQLGTGSLPFQTEPRKVASLKTPAAQLAASFASYCARLTDGTVSCWGQSYYVELGYGRQADTSGPVPISGLGKSVTQIAAGSAGTICALLSDGGIWCWGMISNAAGVSDRQPVPSQVAGLPAAVEVAAGAVHACGRLADGSVWCWGRNDDGELGNGTSSFFEPLPTQVKLGQPAVEVASSNVHSCARLADGTLWCWGANNFGQLGDGSELTSPTPVQVAALGNDVRQVSPGSALHTCARLEDGTAWCWGANDSGQLGNGTSVSSPLPVQVAGLSNVVHVSAGDTHTCACTSDGAVWCWGWNGSGQLGSSTADFGQDTTTPVRAAAPGTVFVEVSAGPDSTCARADDGAVWCWGSRNNGLQADGQLGFSPSAIGLAGCP
jgi:alpha-tubulin suppressor-like RCC1 family protein